MLTARYKRLRWDADRLVSGSVLCGFDRCSETVAQVFYKADGVCALRIHEGYVEQSPGAGVWTLGNHAKRSYRNAPRRPRRTFMPTGMTQIVRRPDGDLEARSIKHTDVFAVELHAAGQRLVHQQEQVVLLLPAREITIACREHAHYSVIRFADIEREAQMRSA